MMMIVRLDLLADDLHVLPRVNMHRDRVIFAVARLYLIRPLDLYHFLHTPDGLRGRKAPARGLASNCDELGTDFVRR